MEGKLGRGGRVSFGTELGTVGNAGLGKDGCVVGNVGNVGCGSVGIEGKGGNADGLGKFGNVGKGGNCNRWRAASPISMDENIVKATQKAEIKHLLDAIVRCCLELINLKMTIAS